MNIALIPHSKELLENPGLGWRLYEILKIRYTGTTIDWKIISEYDDWNVIDYFVFYNFNYSWGLSILKKINRMRKRNRIIFCMMEPDTVIFFHSKKYLPLIKRFTDCIVTWNKDMVNDRDVFFSFFHGWQSGNEAQENVVPLSFEDKKLLCNISCNKFSKHADELYSERVRVIEYFEKNHSNDFELYGKGWESCHYLTYRGTCITKEEVYRKFRFALSLENEKNVRGYITEKILDCIKSSIVPIYAGADDIAEYIPKGCFIAYDEFANLDRLYEFLISMDSDTYENYMIAQKNFVLTCGYAPFTIETWGHNVIHAIKNFRPDGKDKISLFWFFVISVIAFKSRVLNLADAVVKKVRRLLSVID